MWTTRDMNSIKRIDTFQRNAIQRSRRFAVGGGGGGGDEIMRNGQVLCCQHLQVSFSGVKAMWALSRENLSFGVCDQLMLKQVCSATVTS